MCERRKDCRIAVSFRKSPIARRARKDRELRVGDLMGIYLKRRYFDARIWPVASILSQQDFARWNEDAGIGSETS